MPVTDRQQLTWPISRDPSKLHDYNQLRAVALVKESRLGGGVKRLQELELIFGM